MELAERVKKRREELGWSQEELANKMGYSSRTSINKIENGRACSQKIIVRLSKALDVSVSYLMGWEDATNEEVEETKEKNNNEKIAIGQLLKQIREQHNLTLQEMASEISISINTLQKYESGEVEAPQVILKAYSKYFGVDINELLHVKIDEKSSHSSFISTNPDLVENIERWESEIGYNVFSKEEIDKIFEYAKFLLYLKEQK